MRARPCAALHSTLALAVLAAMVVLAATTPAAAAAVASPASAPDTDARPDAVTQSEPPPRDGTDLVVGLRANGNARWTVSTTFALENESDRAAFEELANRYERGDTDVGFDIEAFRRANRAANATVNRSMRITSVERNSTVIEGENGTATGRLTLNFTWTNFARTTDGRLRVGSAFNTSDGTWLPGLATGQTLEIRPPAGYGIVTATVPPRAGVLRWTGPTTFEPGDVAATFARNRGQTPTPTPGTGSPTTATPTPPTNGPDLSGVLWLVGGIGGLLLLAGALLALRRREDDTDPAPVAGADTPDDGAAAESTTATANGGDTGGGAAGAAAAAEEPEPELLSDEERVERLLEQNGGRMKQANIVSETGWSNAKVSQLLSAMDEDDRIDKLRIGRENLISLPDEDVTDFEE